jgi:hypothetical protein
MRDQQTVSVNDAREGGFSRESGREWASIALILNFSQRP